MLSKDLAGIGSLELLGMDRRLAFWRYTTSKSPAAHRFVEYFEKVRKGDAVGEEEVENPEEANGHTCPLCGTSLASENSPCPECDAEKVKSGFNPLWRLALFAKKQWGIILLGMVLLFVGSAINMGPTYITGRLIDNVLSPMERVGEKSKQNTGAASEENAVPAANDASQQSVEKVDISIHLIWYYILGLGAVSVAGWLVKWLRTYVIAWASEKVATDLRNRTYSHMQHLSLEFFGGKRTGDLIARVSTDTDRICYFLSVYVLDFANDILMLMMTAGILFSLNCDWPSRRFFPCRSSRFSCIACGAVCGDGFILGSRAWGEMTERAGRHDPRHSRRQGFCPGTPRSRTVSHGQRPRVPGQHPRQHPLVVLRGRRGVLDGSWACWSCGVMARGESFKRGFWMLKPPESDRRHPVYIRHVH